MPEKMNIEIRPYRDDDEAQVVELWGDTIADAAPHNDPLLAIRLKLQKDPDLFLVATAGDAVVGTVMGGYDGHRGWIYSLAVGQAYRRRRVATALVRRLEELLRETGCLKVNLQVRGSNPDVLGFYEHIGYSIEDRVSLGKRLYNEEGQA
jgi:ribosomal protein S18 acetylase RimI-like enzyme